jgi:hypothetical protein
MNATAAKFRKGLKTVTITLDGNVASFVEDSLTGSNKVKVTKATADEAAAWANYYFNKFQDAGWRQV